MNSWDKRYSDRVQLLVNILPVLEQLADRFRARP